MFWQKEDNFNIKESWGDDKKQIKKTPSSAKNKIPSKNNITDDSREEQSTDILDQIMANKIYKDFVKEGLPKRDNPVLVSSNQVVQGIQPKGVKKPPQGAQDSDLLSGMASRLTKLENLVKLQRQEIKEKSNLIQELTDEVQTLKSLSSQDNQKQINDLKNQNKMLKKQIEEMTNFLKDYGLIWSGENGQRQGKFEFDALKRDISQKETHFRSKLPPEIDIYLLERRIQELNFIAERDNAAQVVKGQNGAHQLKKLEPLPMGFYKNGLVIKGYPFYSYGSKEAEEKFPEGVPLKLVDRITETYLSKGREGGGRIMDYRDLDDMSLAPMKKEEFLQKLPKNIIKDGKILPIREEIAQKFQEKQNNNEEQEKFKRTIIIPNSQIEENQENGELICTLKLRSETGKHNFIVQVKINDTMEQVYQQVSKYSETGNFVVASNFPPLTYELNTPGTMNDFGFYPNAALYLKPKILS